MAKQTETKTEKIEREYIIPLREKVRVSPRYKKTPKAVKTVKQFIARHMKIYDRDLNKIKIDRYLNEYLWGRGIKNPPHKVKVKAIKEFDKDLDYDIVRVELAEISGNLKFKKLREDKREKQGEEASKKNKAEKAKEEKVEEKTKEETAEEKKKTEEVKEEKKDSAIAGMQNIEKQAHKQAKHFEGGKTKEPKHLLRKALAK